MKRPLDSLKIVLGSIMAASTLGTTAAKAQVDVNSFSKIASPKIQACMVEGMKAGNPKTKLTADDIKPDEFYISEQGSSELIEKYHTDGSAIYVPSFGSPVDWKRVEWNNTLMVVHNRDGQINELTVKNATVRDDSENIPRILRTDSSPEIKAQVAAE